MTEQPTIQPTKIPISQMEPKKNSLPLVLCGVVLLLLVIVASVYAGMKIQEKGGLQGILFPPEAGVNYNLPAITPTSAVETPTTYETVYTEEPRSANWKTYKDKEGMFEVKYPSTFLTKGNSGLTEIFSPLCSCYTYKGSGEKESIQASSVRITFGFHKGKDYNDIWKNVFGFEFSEKNFDGTAKIDDRLAYYFFQGAEMTFGRKAYLVTVSPTTALEINIHSPELVQGCSQCFDTNNPAGVKADQILSTFKFLK